MEKRFASPGNWKMIRAGAVVFTAIVLLPCLLLAGTGIPGFYGTASLPIVSPTQLPVLKSGGLLYGVNAPVTTNNQMTISQTQSRAVIDWSSFNIGANASVYFNQQGNAGWAVLNRIWDANPTQILGSLRADGRVYLINQNGILFAPGSQVNVHTLVATSLNLSIDNFLTGTLAFNTQQGTMTAQDSNNNYLLPDSALQSTIYVNRQDTFYDRTNLPGTSLNPGVVSATGTIQTNNGGSVFLIGPSVENGGTISTPSGQIGLVAGTDVGLVNPPVNAQGSPNPYPSSVTTGFGQEARTTLVVKINNSPNGYTATNLEGALLAADTGLVGMYGNIVNQYGIIRSVQGAQNGGHVELFASDTITTGPNSLISLPVSTSADEVSTTFQTAQSTILLSGIDPANPWNPTTSPNLIVLQGAIVAPSANVTTNAVNRVYMAPGSLIDVSGLSISESAGSGQITIQMNTYNLRDDYVQKGGILQGQTIEISAFQGSLIGDVSSGYTPQALTAVERHTAGGLVNINLTNSSGASTGDAVIMPGATINFSGGGILYGAGQLNLTRIVSGNNVYDMSSANPNYIYDCILNSQTLTFPRWNVTQTFAGVYYGGAYPVMKYVPEYFVGNDAGTLNLLAGTVVLDGSILGSVTKGIQQTWSPASMPSTVNPVYATIYREPVGGTLNIGNVTAVNNGVTGDSTNFVASEIVISPQAPALPAGFQPTTALPSSTTYLSSAVLNNAGLSYLGLAANTSITVESGARINLVPAGTFQTYTDSTGATVNAIANGGFDATFVARARKIVNYGDITVPGGNISLSIETDVTSNPTLQTGNNPNYVPIDERIYLAPGSVLSAAGQTIYNVTTGLPARHINGGTINILDETVTGQGVAISPGAVVDVSAGWQIDTSNKLTGGNAGVLSLQGASLILGGDLRAWSLTGYSGGTINMYAANVSIASGPVAVPSFGADDPWPAAFANKLVLGSGQLDGTGFTTIGIKSVNDIIMEPASALGPSLTKLAVPVLNNATNSAQTAANQVIAYTPPPPGLVQITEDQIGLSSISLTAGVISQKLTWGVVNPNGNGVMNPMSPDLSATIRVSQGASVVAGPTPAGSSTNSSVTMGAPYIDIAGLVSAPAGNVTMTAGLNFLLESGGKILAEGYNEAGTSGLLPGLPPQVSPLQGGNISLTATNGNLVLSQGSLVSVSGSAPVQQMVLASDGSVVSSIMNAGAPGSIYLTASGTIQLSGTLTGQAMLPGLAGGTLSITKTDPSGTLPLAVSDLARFRDGGFDALTLSSAGVLSLQGTGQVAFGRSLTLSAPVITGSGTDSITLSAPYVQVTNTSLPPSASASSGSAAITLAGTWLDVTGAVTFSGFGTVTLHADRDLRLSDLEYTISTQDFEWHGSLSTARDLILQAAAVYPTTASIFNINAGGKVTIQPSGTVINGPIYSAGGSLTIQAGTGIEQDGILAAPLGNITLNSLNGRIYLAPGSLTTTKGSVTANGEDLPILYGTADAGLGDNVWGIMNKAQTTYQTSYVAVTGAPSKSISINGNEVIVANGATLDASGGGSVFTYQFFSSYTGTSNPLTGSFVILPDNSIVLPGRGVYLSGVNGLPAGTYSVLPAQFAFLPGAMVVTDLKYSYTLTTGQQSLTSDGYPIATGYTTTMGTNVRSPVMEAYEVRPASVVLAQGDFVQQVQTAGAGGSVSLAGNTTIVNGTIQAGGLTGYSGGSVSLSGASVVVQQAGVSLPQGFGFSTPVPADLANTLTIAASSLSGMRFESVSLGSVSGAFKTSTLEVMQGVTLQADNITLSANSAINIDAGAQVLALAAAGTGQATFITGSSGTVTIGANVVVHASDAIVFQTGSISTDPTAILKADHSSLNLQGSTVTIYDPSVVSAPSGTGIFLTGSQWSNLTANFEDITITSLSDLIFGGSFNLPTQGRLNTLTIDAARIMDSVAGSTVVLGAAQSISIQNTGATAGSGPAAAASSITLIAPQITAGKGSVLFDGFGKVNLNARNDLMFTGVGAIQTGGGNLSITAARVATSYYMDAGTYTAANFTVNAGSGTVTMAAGSGTPGAVTTPGGTLEIEAQEIDISTLIQMPSGQLNLVASGNINLAKGAQLSLPGTAYAPGGVVYLTSTNGGAVNVNAGSLIDVSAGPQGDAGNINLYAPVGGVTLAGNINGQAAGGTGGSFSIVTNAVSDFSGLNTKLYNGGFNNTLNIEALTGDIAIQATDTVRAQNVTITADAGSIDLSGKIDVSQPTQGGTVALYAKNDLNIDALGYIDAHGTGAGASGGTVMLSDDTGRLWFASGAVIDVSGSTQAQGGTVTFRDPPPPPPPPPGGGGGVTINMYLNGTVKGASSVVAEIDTVYLNQFLDSTGSNTVINQAAINRIQSDITTFMTTNSSLASTLSAGLTDGNGNPLGSTFQLRPGVVIEQTVGDITLSTTWSLANWRWSGEPGILTLRAAGNVNIAGSITDNPTSSYVTLVSSNAQPSWGINLVAGSMTQSPNPLAVVPYYVQGATGGNLTISPQELVYTETGNIQFASGGNTVLNQAPSNNYMVTSGMKYSVGTYTGLISGNVSGDLSIDANSAIQSATGSINLRVGGTLYLGNSTTDLGSIRTTGEHAPGQSFSNYTSYSGGGNISIDVGDDIAPGLYAVVPSVGSANWLTTTSMRYGHSRYTVPIPMYGSASTEGIVTMAGGSVYVRAGGNFNGQAGTFGAGNLQVYSGGNINGRFLANGSASSATPAIADISAMGNFGDPINTQLIEVSNAQVRVSAQGGIDLGAMVNPSLIAAASDLFWNNLYTTASSLTLTAVTGNVDIYGSINTARYGQTYAGMAIGDFAKARMAVLPPSLTISAGGNINLYNSFVLLPAQNGNLSMVAGGDIVFNSTASTVVSLAVSDFDPSKVYGLQMFSQTGIANTVAMMGDLTTSHPVLSTGAPLHAGDTVPITISAGGNITDMNLTAPKAAHITAGGNITDLYYSGENMTPNDVTSIIASGNILYGYVINTANERIELGGPGYLFVAAGGSIDLGNTVGIQTIANGKNSALSQAGASLVVASGLSTSLSAQQLTAFADSLHQTGVSNLADQLAGNKAAAQGAISSERANVISPFVQSYGTSGGGITMTSSQISTTGGGSIVVATTGTLDVGMTIIGQGQQTNPDGTPKQTGIFTAAGGGITVFADGDVNVNESRIMTFKGGDITVWSDHGGINAGTGSKAAINMAPPTWTTDPNTGLLVEIIQPPAVGSGIRAMTYTSDINDAGNIYLIAPQGVINAGEAGISGRQVLLSALAVLNVSNILSTAGSVGVPAASQTVSVGALTGSTNLADKSVLSQDTGALGASQTRVGASTQAIEDLVKWVDVKVVGYELSFGLAGGPGTGE
jgi:filamentous hemagglutinin family protein